MRRYTMSFARGDAYAAFSSVETAITQGHVSLLGSKLFDRFRRSNVKFTYPNIAARHGRLRTLKWVVKHGRGGGCVPTASTMQYAAGNGDLAMVKYLHGIGCPSKASVMNQAVASGCMETVRWLTENRAEPCTRWALYYAAQIGSVEMLQYLTTHPRHREGLSRVAPETMDYAAKSGDLRAVLWVHNNRPLECTNNAVYFAAERGHLEVLRWLHANRQEGKGVIMADALNISAANGHLEVVQFLSACDLRRHFTPYPRTWYLTRALKLAAANGRLGDFLSRCVAATMQHWLLLP